MRRGSAHCAFEYFKLQPNIPLTDDVLHLCRDFGFQAIRPSNLHMRENGVEGDKHFCFLIPNTQVLSPETLSHSNRLSNTDLVEGR